MAIQVLEIELDDKDLEIGQRVINLAHTTAECEAMMQTAAEQGYRWAIASDGRRFRHCL